MRNLKAFVASVVAMLFVTAAPAIAQDGDHDLDIEQVGTNNMVGTGGGGQSAIQMLKHDQTLDIYQNGFGNEVETARLEKDPFNTIEIYQHGNNNVVTHAGTGGRANFLRIEQGASASNNNSADVRIKGDRNDVRTVQKGTGSNTIDIQIGTSFRESGMYDNNRIRILQDGFGNTVETLGTKGAGVFSDNNDIDIDQIGVGNYTNFDEIGS